MEKLSFLVILLQIYSVQCCQNFRNDYLVPGSNSVQCVEVRSSGGEGKTEKSITEFFEDIAILNFESFSSIAEHSQCRLQMREILREAEELNIGALKMLDAPAKLPSGILSGNLNQYGDFDECLDSGIFTKKQHIKGKYCLANVDIRTDRNNTNEKIKNIDALIHSNWMLHNEFRDKGHRIPKFETFNVGVCVPASCNSEDIETALGNRLNKTFQNDFFKFKVAVDDDVCYVKESNRISTMENIVKLTFISTLALIVLGTLVDLNKIDINNAKFYRILRCFSIKNNLRLLLNTNSSQDDIKCIHGARFLNAVALLLSHKQIAMLFSPFMNRTQMSESISKSWTMIGRSAILYTDSFILFSGLLASYSMIKDLDSKKSMKFREKFVSRLFRLTPNLVCVILFCTFIMDSMGSGPQWGLVVGKYTNLCKKYMWRNFLFIHNYFGFENMCLTHTHQLGIDMQLFVLSPVFIYLIWKVPKIGILVSTAVAVASTWLRYDKTYTENLSTLLYYGISVERLWKTANTSYILPTHRLTVYLTGVLLGYFLRRGGRSLKLSTLSATIGWTLAITAGIYALFGPHQAAFKEYEYDVNDAARFNAFAPVLWTVFISWGVVACLNGSGGIFNDFLSWKYFTIFTKISYAVYLTQFPVFFYNVGTERTPQYYKGFQSLFDVPEMSVIFITSIALTLIVDIPFQELRKVITSPKSSDERRSDEGAIVESIPEGSRRRLRRKRLQSFGT